MKPLSLIMAACLLAGCHAAAPLSAPSHPVTLTVPDNAHLVWCDDPFGCYESADLFCGEGGTPQHPKPGHWHQVVEEGMSFPAIVQDGAHSWRMMIACDKETP